MKEETIRIQNLSTGYFGKKGTKVIAQNICATIPSGELTCLLGANGAGKSTLLRTLSAFLRPLSGEIWIRGKRLTDYTDKELATVIGVVLTEKCQLRNMTVTELIGMGRSPYTGFWGTLSPKDKQIVSEAIALVRIEELKERMVHTLSDGERQKVMIAKALAQETPVIYLDEPTAFLDYPSKVDTMLLLRQLAHETGKTIFLSTHDVELALQTADTLWLMKRYRAKGEGSQVKGEGGFSLPTQGETPQPPIESSTIKPLTIGSPKELAENGALGQFFTGKDFTFDQQEMRFRIVASGE